MLGAPHLDADAPSARAWSPVWPSNETSRSSAQPGIGSIVMTLVGRTHERAHRERVGADRRDRDRLDAGHTIGPPALSEYAVEPVGVATMMPSAL